MAISRDASVCDKEQQKLERKTEGNKISRKNKMGWLWTMNRVVVISAVAGVLGTTTTKFEK